MIIKNDKEYGYAYNDEKFFKENFEKIKPLKQITVFFDDENFLLTDYITEVGTTFVAESWNGNQIHLTGLNCGYGGTSPSATARILNSIGMDFNTANELKYYPALTIKFKKDGAIEETSIEENKNIKCFFSSQGEHTDKCNVFIDRFSYVDFNAKKLYFINPQVYHPRDIYNAIQIIKPYKLQYFIGNDSPLDNSYMPSFKFFNEREIINEHVTGVNLILFGKKLDILFLIDKNFSHSFINMISYYILKEPLFNDSEYIIKSKSKFTKRFFNLLYDSSESTHGVINIDNWR